MCLSICFPLFFRTNLLTSHCLYSFVKCDGNLKHFILPPLQKAKGKKPYLNNYSEIKKKIKNFQLSLSRNRDALKNRYQQKSYLQCSKFNVTIKAFLDLQKKTCYFFYISVTRVIFSRKFLNKYVQIIQQLMLNISKKSNHP